MSVALRRYPEDESWESYSNAVSELSPAVGRPVAPVARPQLSSSTAVVNASRWAPPTIDHQKAVAVLPNNWDQRGSTAPRADVISFAWNILAQNMPYDGKVPVVVPLGNGGVQLEWSAGHTELEIEINRPFDVSALFFSNDDEVEVGTETLDELTRIIRQYFRA